MRPYLAAFYSREIEEGTLIFYDDYD